MAVRGVFRSDSGGMNDRVGSFSHHICKTYPTGDSPLFALTSGMRRIKAHDTTINWDEEAHFTHRILVMSDNAANCCTIDLEDTSTVIQGDIYEVEATGEIIHILAVVGNTVTIRRSVGQSGAWQIPAGSYIQNIGTAFAEGSEAPTGFTMTTYPRFNYTQIFKAGWGVTGTAKHIKRRSTNNLYAKHKREAAQRHARQMEYASIWGIRSYGFDHKGRKLLTMDGINRQILTNRWTIPKTGLSREMLNLIIKIVYSRNVKGMPNERITLCGSDVVSVINDIIYEHTTYEINHTTTTFGMDISKWKTPHGMLTFVSSPLMNESPKKMSEMYIYHPGAITQWWLRDTFPEENNKNGSRNGIDADQGHLISEKSISYACEITGALIYNICKPDLRKIDHGYKNEPCCPANGQGCGCAPTADEIKQAA